MFGKKIPSLRRIFQMWLLLFVFASFCITFGLSYLFQTRAAQNTATRQAALHLDYMGNQVNIIEDDLKDLKKDLSDGLIEKAKIFAVLLKYNPSLLHNKKFLRDWSEDAGIKEISIVGKKGVVIEAFPKEFIGTDFNKYDLMHPYLPLIDKKDGVYVEDLRTSYNQNGSVNSLVQFVGVSRLDAPGVIQMGYSAERYANALKTAVADVLADDYVLGKHGFVIVSKDGKIISAGRKELKGLTLADSVWKFVKDMPENTLALKTIDGLPVFLVTRSVNGHLLTAVMPKSDVYAYRNMILSWAALVYILLLTIVYIFLSALLERVVVRGIKKTNTTLEKITRGDLNEKVRVRSNLEFVSLSNGINAMVDALKKAIAEAAARLDKELEFAREIQRATLPNVFPPYPNRNEFDIFASMTAAKEVGGDFYDFFLLGHGGSHVGIVIADVSGKGIPAALFMMSAKTLIKNLSETGMPPAEVFYHANQKLCENNEAGMFVTAFMGILELKTGKFTYVNAGHNPPLIKRADGGFERMTLKPGFMLGAMDSFVYQQEEIFLNGGDTVFLYTDGVTEAQNSRGQLFGDDRLNDLLNKNTDKAPKELLTSVHEAVAGYVAGAEQSDDLTMLALSYNPKTVTVPAEIENLDEVMSFVSGMLQKASATPEVIAKTNIVLDEVFTNICSYAYAPAKGTATVRCAVGGTPAFVSLEFRDSGKPFNPLKKEDPDITADLEDREIGNLGIFMVKQIMDSVEYEYKDGQNVLTLIKYLETTPSSED
ncbi:MAG: SpoIIE family protein phosphatase [Alphaproteobacteria bacterium]|nr:SpoIIE family protein phosphatase [Alphaproteobacteria bacterium]